MVLASVLLFSQVIASCEVPMAASPLASIAAVSDWDAGREDDFFSTIITLDGGANRTCESGPDRMFQTAHQLSCTFSNASFDGTRAFSCNNMNTLYGERIAFGGRVAADGRLVVDGAAPIAKPDHWPTGNSFTYRGHKLSLWGGMEIGPDGQPRLVIDHLKILSNDGVTDRCQTLFSTVREKSAPLMNR